MTKQDEQATSHLAQRVACSQRLVRYQLIVDTISNDITVSVTKWSWPLIGVVWAMNWATLMNSWFAYLVMVTLFAALQNWQQWWWQLFGHFHKEVYCCQSSPGLEARRERREAGSSDLQNWAVFAARAFSTGDVVERCELILLDDRAMCMESAVMQRSTFDIPCDEADGDIASHQRQRALPLGFSLLYRGVEDDKTAALAATYLADTGELVLRATCDLAFGQEIRIQKDQKDAFLNVSFVRTCKMEADAGSNQDAGGSLHSRPCHTKGSVVVAPSTVQGRGAFATQSYQAGECIEVCPALIFDKDIAIPRPLDDFYMTFEGGWRMLALGCGAIYNHRDAPTQDWYFLQRAEAIAMVANQSISEGDEMFITYGSNYWKGWRSTMRLIN